MQKATHIKAAVFLLIKSKDFNEKQLLLTADHLQVSQETFQMLPCTSARSGLLSRSPWQRMEISPKAATMISQWESDCQALVSSGQCNNMESNRKTVRLFAIFNYICHWRQSSASSYKHFLPIL